MKIVYYVKKLIDVLFKVIKIDHATLLFISFNGQYNDNPKYISEELYIRNPHLKYIWVISDRCHESDYLPSYIKKIKPETLKFYYYKNKANVIIDNGIGITICNSKSRIRRQLVCKTRQLNLSTWHGTPLKKIGADSLRDIIPNKENFVTSANYVLAGSEYSSECLKSAWYDKVPVLCIGTPRNDVLFKSENYKENIYKKLDLSSDYKYVLFIPTYRNNPDESGIIQMDLMNINVLLKTFESKFGGKWKFIYRVHNLVLNKIDKGLIEKNPKIIDGNKFDDMQEYLLASDAIITDYSGAIFDIFLTDKPCFLFAHDRINYINNERGLYNILKYIPNEFADSFSDLLVQINKYNFKLDMLKRHDFLNKIGNVEDGNSTLRTINIIENHLFNN